MQMIHEGQPGISFECRC